MIKDWTDDDAKDSAPPLESFTEWEQMLLKDASLDQIRMYGRLDQATLEAIIVGFLVADTEVDGRDPSVANAEKISDAGIERSWFEKDDCGALFADFMAYYRAHRRLCSIEDAYVCCTNKGQNINQASMYKKMAERCRAAAYYRSLNPDLVIERMVTHHLMQVQNRIMETAQRERNDPKIGPRKSFENMRAAVLRDLADPRDRAAVKEADWIDNADAMSSWLRDMRDHPERHRGCMSGIIAIDSKTHGFRAGHLTVFVGGHGGFKSLTMMNAGYGLWMNGHNVLYVSLEMEPELVQARLWSLALGLSFSAAYGGHLSDNDLDRIRTFSEQMKAKPNRIKFVDFGQSKKVKASQIERWLDERPNFKPHVVIVDYLDLMTAESEHWDRPDIALGDVCKYLRGMGKERGFSVITAAQLNRSAIALLRKTGLDSPEKAQLDTDCIAGSHQIGADADNVFILWPQGGGKLRRFTSKARNGIKDIQKGQELRVDPDHCLVRDADDLAVPVSETPSSSPSIDRGSLEEL